jgi:hypothetical protein
MKYLFIFSFFFFGFVCSTGSGSQKEKKEVQNPPLLNEKQTIISAGDDGAYNSLFGSGYKKWELTEKDIDNAEKLIMVCFENQKMGTVNRFVRKSPEDYCKQFVGAINFKGEKTIWVNCFCEKYKDDFEKWKTEIVFVKDGGNCYFNIKINVDKNEYYDLNINGNG